MSFSLPCRAALPWGALVLAASACGTSSPTGGDGPSAPSAEFRVAQPSALTEGGPVVALGPAGGFAVGWVTNNRTTGPNDPVLFGFRARRFDATGRAQGNELVIRPESTDAAPRLRLAFDTRGGLLAVWAQKDGIFGRRYDASGAAVGAPFALRPGPAGDIFALGDIFVTDASDTFVLFWSEFRGDVTLFGRRFTTDGIPLGEPFALVPSAGPIASMSIRPRDDGRFTLVWVRLGAVFGDSFLEGQIVSDGGVGAGPVFSAALPRFTGSEVRAAIPQPGGGTAVIWKNNPVGGRVVTPVFLLLQRFDAAGSPLGAPVRLLPSVGDSVSTASVSGGNDFVVAWSQPDASAPLAQRFASDGTPQGSPIPLATMASGSDPVVAADGTGTFVAAWQQQLTNESKTEIWARRVAR
jgi:hypothetical protein